jgi:hypothetical protein
VKVTITVPEYSWAAHAGVSRQHQNVLRGRVHANGCAAGYDPHVTGAVGEFVASLAVGVPWRGPGQFRGEDLAGGHQLQVRATEHRNGRLILHPDDPDECPFVLATGGPLEWTVPGWVYGGDGKADDYWPGPHPQRPAFYVPQDRLRPVSDLRRILLAAELEAGR